MLTRDLLYRIRAIELRTRRLVHNTFAGAYQSVYKGRGMAFTAVRPYIPGDDVRLIDWKVTARTGEPFVKQYIEERELTVMLLIDGSASVLFGTSDRQKRDIAAELGAVLAYSATSNNDRAGLMIFSDHVEHYVPPRKGQKHIMRLIRDLLTFETSGKGTDLNLALQTLNRILAPGAIIFVISDFLLPGTSYYKPLVATSQKHEVVAIVVNDPLEERIPNVGLLSVQDAETGEVHWADTGSEQWQRRFQMQRETLRREREDTLMRANVGRINIQHDGDYIRALTFYFREHAGRRHRR